MDILYAVCTYQDFFLFVKPHSVFMVQERKVVGE